MISGGGRHFYFTGNQIALGVLLSIFLLIPVFFGGRFADSLKGLSWSNTSDTFILTWSTGITSLFISIVFVELFRQSLRGSYLYLFLIFFTFGCSELLYSLFSVEIKDAIWFKASGAFVSGAILVTSVFFFNNYAHDYLFSLLKSFLIVLILGLFFTFLPFSGVKYFLPAYLSSGYLTLPILCFLYISSLFFIGGALPWLNSYLRQPQRENLVIGLCLISLGELFALAKFLIYSSFFWWIWHFAFLFLLLALALYLLISCLKRSFTWKIVMVISFLFSITMLLSFWSVRKYYERRERELTVKLISANITSKHQKYIDRFKEGEDFITFLASTIANPDLSEADTFAFIMDTSNNFRRSKYDNICFISSSGNKYIADQKNIPKILEQKIQEIHLHAKPEELNVSMIDAVDSSGQKKRKFIVFFQKLKNDDSISVIYDASFLLSRQILSQHPDLETDWGKIIFNTKTGKIIYAGHPPSISKDSNVKDKFLPEIASLLYKSKQKKQKMLSELLQSDSFLFFGTLEPVSRWLIIDYSYGELVSGKTALHIHLIAAMLSMMLGLVVMLILMNKILNRPIKQLMTAAISLQSGNFDYRTNTKREDEVGMLEHVFDQTAERLNILYNNLRMTIVEKDDVLLKIRKIEKEKRDFFNALSHELKTPIHSIINFSRFGANSSSSTIKEYFDKIHECSVILLNIIEELLQIAKLDSLPKRDINLFSLKDVLLESIWKFNAQILSKQIKIESKFIPENQDFAIFADKKQIEILFSNIIGNAVKYTQEGSTVSVLLEKKDNLFSVKVSDQGPGIAEHEMGKLFKEFVRLSQNKEKGTGLGLYISKKIVEMHNGTIYAVNNTDKGVSFFITLPVRNEKKN